MAAKKDHTQSKVLTTSDAGGMHVYQHNAQLPAAVKTQWEYGDWHSLKAITVDGAEQQEARALLAAIIAVAHHQDGSPTDAQAFLQKAEEWGMDKRAIARVFAAGAFNSLGRAALLAGNTDNALTHFRESIETGIPDVDYDLMTPIRANHQGSQLGIQVSIPYRSMADAPPQLEDNSRRQYTDQLMAIMGSFAQRLVQYGKELVVDGVEVFREKDPFLSGKIAMGLAYWTTEHPSGSAITKFRCQQFRKVMRSLDNRNIETWGIHFYLKALQMLNEAELLTECFSFKELVELKNKLDWRSFVNEADYTLIKKPNNFYGIAYSIAYTRHQLGWDTLKHSQNLLEKELDHYDEVSGGEGFADETNGKGRFDRYSFLLIAEIAYRFYEAGVPLTPRMKKWLKASADYVLFNVNERGDGFQWGRSIGAYGDSAFLEILTAAAVHNQLDERELPVACYFAQKISHKFLNFWYQADRQSINIWTDGRATDGYRGKHRILGENLSLLHQHLYCQRHWNKLYLVFPQRNLKNLVDQWIVNQPTTKVTKLQGGKAEYAIVTSRLNGRLINIPLVNGERYWRQAAYQPVPYINGLITTIPDSHEMLFTPSIHIDGEGWYAIYPCYEKIKKIVKEKETIIKIKFNWLSSSENSSPEKDIAVIGEIQVVLNAREIFYEVRLELVDDLNISEVVIKIYFCAEFGDVEDKKLKGNDSQGRSFEFSFCNSSNVRLKRIMNSPPVQFVQGKSDNSFEARIAACSPKKTGYRWSILFQP